MKKWYCLRIIVFILSINCFAQKSTKDYVRLSGKITDKNSDSLLVFKNRTKIKRINVNKDGSFSDTLRIKEGYYGLFDGKEQGFFYLKNGYNLKITFDTKQWDETMTFKGDGEIPNTYLFKKALYTEKATADKSIFKLENAEFTAKIDEIVVGYQKLLVNTKGLEASFIALEKKDLEEFKKSCMVRYNKTTGLKKHQQEILPKGKVSPKFFNYENYDGTKTSLDDFKGKFVYIDLWATWCGPCKKEIPFLKTVEKEFHDQNIAFVSISTDRVKDHDKWKKMVTGLQLTGVQLFANGDTSFEAAYEVNNIPRFILIDPQGNIVDPNAPRPSEDRLKVVLKEAGVH
ncbi:MULTISPECIES: TlpA disulfide reductase family protein [Flavobacterium]|uniref:TlpA family protein disulfide reductase n=1 Tax=Flavobacterium lipolyticum TaxID=2893754 RepID=A0ABS8M1Y8_9FLAO|nr:MULTISPECIES: TlpA disulfide reductase family protein [unclassified Flavobacterium]MCC9018694.1 TlpA family protein disulfide reductase [Flavobacterium sp. F-126]